MKQSFPTYQELDQVLNDKAIKLHASQVHGLICGILCGHSDSSTEWKELIKGNARSVKIQEMLQSLHDMNAKQLDEFLFEFQLILPPDTETLPARAEALTLWCQGFLTGLKLVQIQITDREPGDVTEAINDLIEIAKMNYEEVVASEEDEKAYVELVEYVRMAIILIYQAIYEERQKPIINSSNYLH